MSIDVENFEQYVRKFSNHFHYNETFTKENAANLLSELYDGNILSLIAAHDTIFNTITETYINKGYGVVESELQGKAAEKIAIFGTLDAWIGGFKPEHHWSEGFQDHKAPILGLESQCDEI